MDLVTESLTAWLSGTLCLLAVACELRAIRKHKLKSAWLLSPLALPFYAAGIFQWFLFGFAKQHTAILVTCALQLVLLVALLKHYVQTQRGAQQ